MLWDFRGCLGHFVPNLFHALFLKLSTLIVIIYAILVRYQRSTLSECSMPDFDILEEITAVETIAVGKQIRELSRLEKQYGSGKWYEAHGIGKKEFKRKRYLD